MSAAAPSRIKNLRTPGAPVVSTPELVAEGQAEAAALEAEILSEKPDAAATTATEVAPDIQALITEGIRKGVAQALATQRKATTEPVTQGPLPDQSEIDAFAIKKEVLTAQGYVVPAQYPQPAGLPQSLR
jgi:hypothetical protein